ncbi:hypothetical protein QR680_007089 [Steinernema hermaphroditum]|uniref:Uncharacterized protein n=1 Tax=Steinernema hermaphroditum TaxID=289476 RepID=A0AA39LYH4_9BILA|nr:hypothetical protein QR680_007089 [Steinernema hermaphroditum]
MNAVALLVLLVFYTDFAFALRNESIECFVVRKTKMNRYDRPLSKPVKPSDVLDWIRSVSKTPLREIPGVGLVFKTFDTLMTVAGYQPASPVMNFLREFREDMQREFRKIYHVIHNVDYQRMHRELQTLSKTKLISGLLQYYFEAPDIQIKETYLCDMCNTEPAIILQQLQSDFVKENSHLAKTVLNLTHHAQEEFDLLRVELQSTVILLTGAAKLCTEVRFHKRNRVGRLSDIEKDYNALMGTLQKWENDRKKLLLESRIIPDYLLTEYYEKLSKDQLAILDYTHSEYAIESQNQLKDLAEKMSNDIGHHFGITISIFLAEACRPRQVAVADRRRVITLRAVARSISNH